MHAPASLMHIPKKRFAAAWLAGAGTYSPTPGLQLACAPAEPGLHQSVLAVAPIAATLRGAACGCETAQPAGVTNRGPSPLNVHPVPYQADRGHQISNSVVPHTGSAAQVLNSRPAGPAFAALVLPLTSRAAPCCRAASRSAVSPRTAAAASAAALREAVSALSAAAA